MRSKANRGHSGSSGLDEPTNPVTLAIIYKKLDRRLRKGVIDCSFPRFSTFLVVLAVIGRPRLLMLTMSSEFAIFFAVNQIPIKILVILSMF